MFLFDRRYQWATTIILGQDVAKVYIRVHLKLTSEYETPMHIKI